MYQRIEAKVLFQEKYNRYQFGMLCYLVAVVFWFLHNFLCKIVQVHNVQIIFYCCSILGITNLLIVKYFNIRWVTDDTVTLKLIFIRSFFGVGSYLSQMLAFSLISLAEHQAIFNLGPIWVGLLAYLFLKEPYRSKEAICAIVGFLGLVFIVRPPFIWNLDGSQKQTSSEMIGKILVLFASLCYSSTVILSRLIGNKASPFQLSFFFCLSNSIFSYILLFFIELKEWTYTDYAILPILALSMQISQLLMIKGVQLVKPGIGTILQYLLILFGFLADIFVFDQVPGKYDVLGCLLIFSSAFFIFIIDDDQEVDYQLRKSLYNSTDKSYVSDKSRISIM